MKRRKLLLILAICAAFLASSGLSSCGTIRSHWGIEHEYDFPDGDYYYGKPHKKHKKHKKPKKPKHHKHHDHDDWYDD